MHESMIDPDDFDDTPPCERGEHEWEFQDDSFGHEFGTERVHYFQCQNCDATRGVEPGDFPEDDYEPARD